MRTPAQVHGALQAEQIALPFGCNKWTPSLHLSFIPQSMLYSRIPEMCASHQTKQFLIGGRPTSSSLFSERFSTRSWCMDASTDAMHLQKRESQLSKNSP
jgi:hypothetical protein